ncbi:MAG: hypothetical protein ABSA57_02655 [Candidatus Acidiferrales bacterium]|jgi:hypothetical protein
MSSTPKAPSRAIAEETEKSGARSAILLAAVLLLVAVFSVMFGLQTLVWFNAKRWASQDPWLADTPQPLPAATSAPPDAAPLAAGKNGKNAKPPQLKAYDYEFTAPWPGNVKTVPASSSVQFQFDSGQVVVFFDPESQVDIVRQMKSGETTQYQQFQNVFGDQAPDTNYALYQTVYSASPAQISPFMHSQDALRTNVLLLWKLSFGFDAQPGIHSFELGKNRGFEFGDVTTGRPVALRVFDERDAQFRFVFSAMGGASGKFTQDDINVAVQSLQSVPILER